MSGGSARREAEHLAGGVLAVGLASTSLDAAEREALRALDPAGVTLFARNVQDAAQLRALTAELRALLDAPLVAIDQEGGRVDRLRGFRGRTPSARELEARGIEVLTEEASRTARDLATLGINVNWAPVVDLDEGNDDNGIGDRAWSAFPARTAACARAVVAAHAEQGVATCLKHFPGLGRTRVDTHERRPSLDAGLGELMEHELVPYRLVPGSEAVMVSHVALPAIDGGDTPASLSRAVITGLLRRRLGFEGVVVSDDLAMGAVSDRTPEEQAVAALVAGCDLLLYCQPTLDAARRAHAALVDAAGDPTVLSRLRDAAARVLSWRRSLSRRRAAIA